MSRVLSLLLGLSGFLFSGLGQTIQVGEIFEFRENSTIHTSFGTGGGDNYTIHAVKHGTLLSGTRTTTTATASSTTNSETGKEAAAIAQQQQQQQHGNSVDNTVRSSLLPLDDDENGHNNYHCWRFTGSFVYHPNDSDAAIAAAQVSSSSRIRNASVFIIYGCENHPQENVSSPDKCSVIVDGKSCSCSFCSSSKNNNSNTIHGKGRGIQIQVNCDAQQQHINTTKTSSSGVSKLPRSTQTESSACQNIMDKGIAFVPFHSYKETSLSVSDSLIGITSMDAEGKKKTKKSSSKFSSGGVSASNLEKRFEDNRSSSNYLRRELQGGNCLSQETPCTFSDTCCDGLKCIGFNVDDTACRACAQKFMECDVDSDCCDGGNTLMCQNKRCESCKAVGKKCQRSGTCCSQFCTKTNRRAAKKCAILKTPNDRSTPTNPSPTPPTNPSPTPSPTPPTGPTSQTIVPGSGECIPYDFPCNLPGDTCCNGLKCLGFYLMDKFCVTCADRFMPCQTDQDCCNPGTRHVCLGGVCTWCKAVGLHCQTGTDCCSGICQPRPDGKVSYCQDVNYYFQPSPDAP